jgi:hypothetical protein
MICSQVRCFPIALCTLELHSRSSCCVLCRRRFQKCGSNRIQSPGLTARLRKHTLSRVFSCLIGRITSPPCQNQRLFVFAWIKWVAPCVGLFISLGLPWSMCLQVCEIFGKQARSSYVAGKRMSWGHMRFIRGGYTCMSTSELPTDRTTIAAVCCVVSQRPDENVEIRDCVMLMCVYSRMLAECSLLAKRTRLLTTCRQ